MTLRHVKQIVTLLVLCGSTNASLLKIGDLITDQTMLRSKIAELGISGAGVSRVKNYINTSIDSLAFGKGSSSLLKMIQGLNVEKSDLRLKADLMRTLKSSPEDISSDEFIEMVNKLVLLSERYGIKNADIVSCSVCVSEQMSLKNLKKTLVKVKSSKIKSALSSIPRRPTKLTNYIKRNTGILGIQDTLHFAKEGERKPLALFMEMSRRADKGYKEFTENVMKFNTVNGKIILVGPQAPSKLWKILSSSVTDAKIEKWNKVISQSLKAKNPAKRKEAFYNKLISMANGDAEKLDDIKQMRANNCFFK